MNDYLRVIRIVSVVVSVNADASCDIDLLFLTFMFLFIDAAGTVIAVHSTHISFH